MGFWCIVHHTSQVPRQYLRCVQLDHILGHAWLGNTVGGRQNAQEDGRLVILFTKSNLSWASENSLISFLLGELYSIHFNIYLKKEKKRLKRKSICIAPLSGFIQQHYFSSEGK